MKKVPDRDGKIFYTSNASLSHLSESFWFVLKELYEASQEGIFVGREKLLAKAKECFIPISQQEIRGILARMSEEGLARVGRGRGGSRLTLKGRKMWEEYQDDLSGNYNLSQ